MHVVPKPYSAEDKDRMIEEFIFHPVGTPGNCTPAAKKARNAAMFFMGVGL